MLSKLNTEAFVDQRKQLIATDTATLLELDSTIQVLNERHNPRSAVRQIDARLEPFILFIERYAKSVDILSQGVPVAAIIWGSLRVLLEMASSASRYFQKGIDMLERLGSQVCLYARYEDLFEVDDHFATALASTYSDIIDVLRKARQQSTLRSHKPELAVVHPSKQMKASILDWIAPHDVSADLVTHSGKKMEGTGTWILDDTKFREWRDCSESSLLWISGTSGTGKTVLAAHVVQHLTDFDTSKQFLDGLDECDGVTDVAIAIKGLLASAATVHVIVFSRDVPQIRLNFGFGPIIALDGTRTRQDIDRFSRQSVARLMLNDIAFEENVANTLAQRADGMFLWAARATESLKGATNPGEVSGILSGLPAGIDAYYEKCLWTLAHDHPYKRKLAETVLQRICCIARPLTWVELECLLSFNQETVEQDRLQTPFQNVVLEICAPFIKIDNATRIIQLQHHSAREFLLQQTSNLEIRGFHVDEAEIHHGLAEICLRQLIAQPSGSHLIQYATLFWLDHLLQASCDESLQALILTFVTAPAVLEKWLLDRMRWDSQRGFSMSKILGSQSVLNSWMQSSPNAHASQYIYWTGPLVRALLRIDRLQTQGRVGHQELWLSHLEKLMIMRDVARVLTQNNMLDQGIAWFEAALDQRRHKCTQLDNCWIMSALGILYDQKNDFQRSLDLHSHVLNIQETQLGGQSLETLWTVNEMGRVHRHLHDYENAEKQHQKALRSLHQILPNDHLEIIWTLNTLAHAYRKNGKLTEALSLHQQALSGQERALGVVHLHPLWTKGDIGKWYLGLGNLDKAEEFFRACLKGRTTLLGMGHVDSLWTMAKLGQVLAARNHREEAFGLLQRAFEGQTSKLGSKHAQTLKTAIVLRGLETTRPTLFGVTVVACPLRK
ncbi:TPR-12 multi-domain protein [Pyrenophora tritici-repentis]|nr:TPR-12 multi-domain protein [Pyrenophora tritici-repentis]